MSVSILRCINLFSGRAPKLGSKPCSIIAFIAFFRLPQRVCCLSLKPLVQLGYHEFYYLAYLLAAQYCSKPPSSSPLEEPSGRSCGEEQSPACSFLQLRVICRRPPACAVEQAPANRGLTKSILNINDNVIVEKAYLWRSFVCI